MTARLISRHTVRSLLALLLIVALFSTVYAAWPWWSLQVARMTLARAGVELTQATIQRPTSDTLIIEQARLVHASNSASINVNLSGVQLRYQWHDLWKGYFTELRVDSIAVDIKTLQPPPDTSNTPFSVPIVSPSALLKRLPIKQINLPLLTVDAQLKSGPKHLSGGASYVDGKLKFELASAEPPRLTADLVLDLDDQLELSLKHEAAVLAHISNQGGPTQSVEGQLQLDLSAASAVLQELELFDPANRISGTLSTNWSGQLPATLDASGLQQVNLAGDLQLSAAANDASHQGDLQLKAAYKLAQGSLQIAPEALLSAERVHWPGGAVSAVSVRNTQPIDIRLDAQNLLKLPVAQFDIGPLQLTQSGNRIGIAAGQFGVTEAALDLQSPQNSAAQFRLRLTGLGQLPPQRSAKQAAKPSSSSTKKTESDDGPTRLQPVDVNLDAKLAQGRLQGDWQLTVPNGVLSLHGTLRHMLANSEGEATATLPATQFQDNGRYLPALFAHWPYPFDFSGGQIGFDGRLRWNEAGWSAQGDVAVKDLSGFYQVNLFKGLTTQLHAKYENGHLTVPSTRVSLASLESGVAVRDVQFDVSIAAPDLVKVRGLQAELLGGRLIQPEFDYHWQAPLNTIPLTFEAIQLNQVLTLEQNIEGTGVLDGQVPIQLTEKGMEVKAAHFQVRDPGGVIRYQGKLPQSTLASVPALQLSLDSLKNFHYTLLSANADYAPNGNLLLKVELHGRNPDQAEKRPIHFNLNVRENIPELLRSIQMSRDIGDNIEKRIQDFYQHSPQETAQ